MSACLSPSEMARLQGAVASACLAAKDGNPTAACIKVASANGYGEHMCRRLTERVNGTLSAAYLQQMPESKRADSHPLADMDAVVAGVCGAKEIKSASAQPVMSGGTHRASLRHQVSKVASKVEKPLDERIEIAQQHVDSFKLAAQRARIAEGAAELKVLEFAKSAATLLDSTRTPFKQFEERAMSVYGVEHGSKLASFVAASLDTATQVKRASRAPIILNQTTERCLPVLRQLNTACQEYNEAAKTAADVAGGFDTALEELGRLEAKLAMSLAPAVEEAPASFVSALSMLQPKTAAVAPTSAAPQNSETPGADFKAALSKFAGFADVSALGTALDQTLNSMTATKLPVPAVTGSGGAISLTSTRLSPNYLRDRDAIRSKTLLATLQAEDPIIKRHSTEDIMRAYNELAEIAPTVARSRAALVGALRQYLERPATISLRSLEPFEVGQLAKTDLALTGKGTVDPTA